jgi:hypothetical protein
MYFLAHLLVQAFVVHQATLGNQISKEQRFIIVLNIQAQFLNTRGMFTTTSKAVKKKENTGLKSVRFRV